ncbi:MAG: signal peptide peptidase SppA [Cyanobacteria bacterium J06642_2]
MQLNRILASILIALCLLAVIVGGSRQPSSDVAVPRPSADPIVAAGVGRDRIAVVSLQGPIDSTTAGFAPTGALAVRDRLRRLAEEKSVKGVLLEINSGGGTVGASQELYRAVQAVREAKPIIATVQDVAASGAYYAASATSAIVANPGSLVGSIGVIIQGITATELLDNIGVESATIKTGQYKDILSPFRPLSESDRDLLQALVQDTYEQFVTDVADGRQTLPDKTAEIFDAETVSRREAMSANAVRDLADGRILSGRQALNAGLVDELGGRAEAVETLRQWIGDDDIPVEGDRFNIDSIWRILQSGAARLEAWPTQGSPIDYLQSWMQGLTNAADSPALSLKAEASLPLQWQLKADAQSPRLP